MELFLNPSIKGPWFEPVGYLDTVAKSEMASILRRHGFRWTGYHKTGKYSDLRAAIEDLKSAGFRVTVTQEIVNHFAAMLDHKEKAEEALKEKRVKTKSKRETKAAGPEKQAVLPFAEKTAAGNGRKKIKGKRDGKKKSK